MTFLGETGAVIGTPLYTMWANTVQVIPWLIAAILILVFGYLVGGIVGFVIKKVLDKTKACTLIIKKVGLEKEIGKWDISGFFGLIAKWYIFLIFLTPAAEVVRLPTLAEFFLAVSKWIPKIILAVIIAMAGYVFAEYLAKKVRETKRKKTSHLASFVKVVTMIFVVLIALKQVGIEVSVAENTFLIVLAGAMLGLAIAFGLGFKDEAKGIVKNLKKKL